MAEVIVKQVEGIQFVGQGPSGHWVPMDGPEEFGGMNAGTRPIELLLIGLAGCTGADVASILAKMKVKTSKFEIRVEYDRTTEHPKVFKDVKLIYHFWGKNLDAVRDKLEKAINLSQDRYCGATEMLRQSFEINHEYHIYEVEE
jgi:putative redox protein